MGIFRKKTAVGDDVAVAEDTRSSSEECRILIVRILLLVFQVGAVVCTALCLASCEFVYYRAPTVENIIPPLNGMSNGTDASIGLFNFDPKGQGCQELDENHGDCPISGAFFAQCDLDDYYKLARAGTCIALITGGLALLILWIEFFCCRFLFARPLTALLLVLATAAQAMSFLIFASDVCQLNVSTYTGIPFPCELDQASYYSCASVALYFLTSLMVCATQKPVPVCIRRRNKKDAKKNEDGKSAEETTAASAAGAKQEESEIAPQAEAEATANKEEIQAAEAAGVVAVGAVAAEADKTTGDNDEEEGKRGWFPWSKKSKEPDEGEGGEEGEADGTEDQKTGRRWFPWSRKPVEKESEEDTGDEEAAVAAAVAAAPTRELSLIDETKPSKEVQASELPSDHQQDVVVLDSGMYFDSKDQTSSSFRKSIARGAY